MGLTLATLHIRQEVPELSRLVKEGETIRRHNPHWVSILPADEPDYGYKRLQSIAKKLSCPSLLFYWVDDDEFFLELFSEGKKAALLTSREGESKKIALISSVILGDDSATPALKLAAKCGMIEEQLELVEEALGLSLMQLPQEEPSTVTRDHRLFDEITQKQAELKKRKNLFDTVLCKKSDVPPAVLDVELRHKREAMEGLAAVSPVRRFRVEGKDTSGKEISGELLVCPERAPLHFPDGDFIDRASFAGKQGPCAVRMNENGNVRWLVLPEDDFFCDNIAPSAFADRVLLSISPLEEGHSFLLELNAETGQVLQKVPLAEYPGSNLYWFDSLQRYVYYHNSLNENHFVLLERDLKLDKPLPEMKGCNFYGMDHNDTVFWCQSERKVCTFDVATGDLHTIVPEDRFFLYCVTPEGLLAGWQGSNTLLIFDENGRQIYRHRFKGGANPVVENGCIYVLDRDITPDEWGFRAKTWNTRIWKLEKR